VREQKLKRTMSKYDAQFDEWLECREERSDFLW
jgi:hypothetical protein